MKSKNIKYKSIMFVAVSAIILFMMGFVGMSYSYYRAIIEGSGEPFNVDIKMLVIRYDDTETIEAGNIVPGWEAEKTISVTNENAISVGYKLAFSEFINTFGTGYLKYSVTSTNGGCNVEETSVPYTYSEPTEVSICKLVNINPGATHTYTIKFSYVEVNGEEINYGPDQGQTFFGKIIVGKIIKLELDETSGDIYVGNSKSLTISGYDYGDLSCLSSDNSIATCSVDGTTLIINAINVGNATITLGESILNQSVTYSVRVISSLQH